MKLAATIAIGCILVLVAFAVSQKGGDPDGSEEIIKALAKGYKDERTIDQIKKDNALIRAAQEGDAGAVREAIKNGALVNSRYLDGHAFLDAGVSGYTALMRASLAGHEDVVQILIDAKADLELDRRGRTSLYLAVTAEKEPVVSLLVKAGAKGDPRQIRLAYDLIRAACKGFKMREGEGYPLYPGCAKGAENAPDITEVLKRGADVNAANPEGYTALMYSANLGLVENVKILLAHGADATLKSKDGDTALSLTEDRESSVARAERRQVVKILKAHLDKKRVM